MDKYVYLVYLQVKRFPYGSSAGVHMCTMQMFSEVYAMGDFWQTAPSVMQDSPMV